MGIGGNNNNNITKNSELRERERVEYIIYMATRESMVDRNGQRSKESEFCPLPYRFE